MMSPFGEGHARRPFERVVVLFVLVFGSVLAAGLTVARPALAAPSPADPSALMPSSSTLNFYTQDVHDQSTMQVSFTNTSADPTTVSQAMITGPNASTYSISGDSCSNQTIQPNNGCSIDVNFNALPTGPGLKTATLSVMDDNGINTGTNDIALTGTAITGTLSSDQNTLDFGGLVINQGNSDQQHVTISDNLSASVNVSNVQIAGADASSFYVQNNGCPSTLQPGNTCQIYVQFQPTSAGPQTAQLQIDNDGTTDPLVVSLTGDGLTGPAVTVSPPQAIYGNVVLGAEASQTFMLTNDGDAPLQIQAMFLAAGSPQVFPISDNNCLNRQIAPTNSCRFSVGFIPIAAGNKDGSVFVISNASNPGVTTIGLDGTGVTPAGAPAPAPDGTVTIVGVARAGQRLTCSPHSYSSGTRFSYQWLRDGKPIPGSLGRQRLLGDADVGARLKCRLTATGPGGSQTVTSPASLPALAQLAIDTTSVSADTITTSVTLSRGRLSVTGRITNPQALRPTGCRARHARDAQQQPKRCRSSVFADQTVTVRAGGTYTINLSPNVIAHRALTAGRALHVKEVLVLDATHARTTIHRTFSVIVHGNPRKQR